MHMNLTENIKMASNGHSKTNTMSLDESLVGSINATYDVENKIISFQLNLDKIDGQPEIFDAAIAVLRNEQRDLKKALEPSR